MKISPQQLNTIISSAKTAVSNLVDQFNHLKAGAKLSPVIWIDPSRLDENLCGQFIKSASGPYINDLYGSFSFSNEKQISAIKIPTYFVIPSDEKKSTTQNSITSGYIESLLDGLNRKIQLSELTIGQENAANLLHQFCITHGGNPPSLPETTAAIAYFQLCLAPIITVKGPDNIEYPISTRMAYFNIVPYEKDDDDDDEIGDKQRLIAVNYRKDCPTVMGVIEERTWLGAPAPKDTSDGIFEVLELKESSVSIKDVIKAEGIIDENPHEPDREEVSSSFKLLVHPVKSNCQLTSHEEEILKAISFDNLKAYSNALSQTFFLPSSTSKNFTNKVASLLRRYLDNCSVQTIHALEALSKNDFTCVGDEDSKYSGNTSLLSQLGDSLLKLQPFNSDEGQSQNLKKYLSHLLPHHLKNNSYSFAKNHSDTVTECSIRACEKFASLLSNNITLPDNLTPQKLVAIDPTNYETFIKANTKTDGKLFELSTKLLHGLSNIVVNRQNREEIVRDFLNYHQNPGIEKRLEYWKASNFVKIILLRAGHIGGENGKELYNRLEKYISSEAYNSAIHFFQNLFSSWNLENRNLILLIISLDDNQLNKLAENAWNSKYYPQTSSRLKHNFEPHRIRPQITSTYTCMGSSSSKKITEETITIANIQGTDETFSPPGLNEGFNGFNAMYQKELANDASSVIEELTWITIPLESDLLGNIEIDQNTAIDAFYRIVACMKAIMIKKGLVPDRNIFGESVQWQTSESIKEPVPTTITICWDTLTQTEQQAFLDSLTDYSKEIATAINTNRLQQGIKETIEEHDLLCPVSYHIAFDAYTKPDLQKIYLTGKEVRCSGLLLEKWSATNYDIRLAKQHHYLKPDIERTKEIAEAWFGTVLPTLIKKHQIEKGENTKLPTQFKQMSLINKIIMKGKDGASCTVWESKIKEET